MFYTCPFDRLSVLSIKFVQSTSPTVFNFKHIYFIKYTCLTTNYILEVKEFERKLLRAYIVNLLQRAVSYKAVSQLYVISKFFIH